MFILLLFYYISFFFSKQLHFFPFLFKHMEQLCLFPNNVGIIIFSISIIYFLIFQALNWVFVVDTLNFSFWPERESQQCEVTYKGITYTGYMTLCAAISRAMDEGESMCRARYTLLIMCGWFYCFSVLLALNSKILFTSHIVYVLSSWLLFHLSNGFLPSNMKTNHLANRIIWFKSWG